jgi:serine/threonine protein kinase
MSWIDGSTWNDTLIDRTNLSEDHSKRLAKNTADVLANIGTRGYAHCDIASANVIVNLQTSQVTLIDVEDMYGPGLPRPSAPPQGTPGYQHRQSLVATDGQWSSCGDRFSGAVLLSEMLCWHQAEFRAASDESSFYNQNEVQDPSSPRYRLMKDILDKMSSSIGKLFERAWHSQTLDQCPPLSEWARLFEFPVVSEWVPIKPPPPAPPYQPVFSGPIQVPTPQQWKPQFIPLTMPLAQSSKPTEAPLYFRITRTSPGAPFTFEWLPVRDAEGYVIQEADQEDFKRPREVYRGKETHWEKRADPNSNILYYRVAAFNSQGTGPWSLVNSTY